MRRVDLRPCNPDHHPGRHKEKELREHNHMEDIYFIFIIPGFVQRPRGYHGSDAVDRLKQRRSDNE